MAERGVLLIFRRCFAAAAGALGLAAFAAGLAYGQENDGPMAAPVLGNGQFGGQIPAPGLFFDHLACAKQALDVTVSKPSVVQPGAMASVLDDMLREGGQIVAITEADAKLLQYRFPVFNCGGDSTTIPEGFHQISSKTTLVGLSLIPI